MLHLPKFRYGARTPKGPHHVYGVPAQKTAYEMLRSLVDSEMCIRDRLGLGLRVAD